MAIAGGLDLGYGSQLSIINTKILCVDNTGSTVTTQQAENLLTLYNRHVTETARSSSMLKCDYIALAVAPSDAADTRSAVVIETALGSLVNVPIAGNHANPGTGDFTTARQHKLVDILNISGAVYSDTAVETLAPIAGAADNTSTDAMGDAFVLMEGIAGDTQVVPAGGMIADVLAALTGATVTADTDLSTGFVEKGNAAGTTPTELSDISNAANSIGIVSVTVIAKPAN